MSDALARTLEARSVALVGASARPGSLGRRMVTEAMRSPGLERVHLVNPSYAEVAGLPCVPDLNALDDAPDLVLLGVGDARLVDQLTAAAKVGARGAVVFGSAHADGVRDELRRVATDAGMALVGAGCMGFWNVRRGVRAMGYTERDDLPVGPVSLITHSGSVFSTLLRTRLRLGFDLAVSSGTGAGHDHRRLRRPPRRARRDPGAGPRARDHPRRRPAPLVAAPGPRGRHGGGAAPGRPLAPRLGDGGRALRRGGRRIGVVGGTRRRRRRPPGRRPGRARRHPRRALLDPATPTGHGHRDRPRLRRRAQPGRRPRAQPRRALRRAGPGHPRGPGRPPRRGPGGREPPGRLGWRRRHPPGLRRLPGHDGRRPGGRGDRARRRPGAGARRRHVLPRRAPRGRGRHHGAGGRADRAARRRRRGRRRPPARGRHPCPGRVPQRPARPAAPPRLRRPAALPTAGRGGPQARHETR